MSSFSEGVDATDLVAMRRLAQAGREVALPAKTRTLVEQLCDAIDGLADQVERLNRERGKAAPNPDAT
jgi:hypothetical protein